MTQFYPAPLPVPGVLKTAVFTIRPLTPAHVQLDYDALMVSKPMLRLWSGSPWPTDTFTLADNHGDLEWHDMEHQDRIAFTYTVLTPDESECLGCLYIKPLQIFQQTNPTQLADITQTDACTRFWVKEPRLADQLDLQLLHTLINWFKDAWAFRKHYFHARAAHTQQVQLLESAGLIREFSLAIPNRGGEFHFYIPSFQRSMISL
ncbi:MAG: hypothetical protein GY943_19130 [Chloroflexi bacterium]|nr:hypothetical protein [Chloroflexota bacterium]